jgi:opacity protein-like surface antigen
MKWKLVVSLLALISIASMPLRAQEEQSKVDVFVGYSYMQVNPGVSGVDNFHLNGGSASVAYHANSWLSGVADFGGYTNGNILNSGVSGTISTYLFGPRVSYRHFGRVTPFGQVLFGVARADASAFGTSGSQTGFAMTAGGGVDYQLMRHLALRPVQAEYLLTRFDNGISETQNQNNLRISAGVVFRF